MTPFFSDNIVAHGHERRALRSGAVTIVSKIGSSVVQIGSVLFLARLLSPEDYGLVGMVTAFTGFAPVLVDLGTRDAVVQRSRITEREVSALFWINVLVAIGIAILMAAFGPLISRFYGEPRLTMIVVVSSLTFVTTALSCQHYALMRRAMMFKELGVIEVGANVIASALAIGIAFSGYHYWALVVRPIAWSSLLTLGVWLKCRWMPGRLSITDGVKEMLRFGRNIIGFTMTDFVGRSGDRVAIGYRSGPAALGYYQNAMFVYENLLDVAVSPLHGVAVASFSKLQGNLPELRRLWAKALSTLVFFSMPGFGLLAVVGRDVIVVLLGDKWANAGILLSVLALRGIPHMAERTLGWLHVTAGRTDRWARWGLFATVLQIAAMFAGLPYGPFGVITAYVILMFILFVPALAYAGSPLGIGAKDVIRAVWRPLVGSLTAAALAFALRFTLVADAPIFARIAVLTVVYLLAYLTIAVGILGLREPFKTTFSVVETFLPARLVRLFKSPDLANVGAL